MKASLFIQQYFNTSLYKYVELSLKCFLSCSAHNLANTLNTAHAFVFVTLVNRFGPKLEQLAFVPLTLGADCDF